MARLKIILVGSSAPGKTQALYSLFGAGRAPLQGTATTEWKPVDIVLEDGTSVPIEVYDTPARERSSKVEVGLCGIADGMIVFFDMAWRFGFVGVEEWRKVIATAEAEKGKKIPVLLVGNKMDRFLQEQPQNFNLKRGEYTEFAAAHDFVGFLPICALTGEGVLQAFRAIVGAVKAITDNKGEE